MTLMYLCISSCIPGTTPSGFFPHLILKFIAFLFKKKNFIYLAALGLSWGTTDLLVSAFKLSVAVCGIQFPEQGVVES